MARSLELFELHSTPASEIPSTRISPSSTQVILTISRDETPSLRPTIIAPKILSTSAYAMLVGHLTMESALTSVTTGLITVGIPRMASDLALDSSLIYWPVLVYALTCASCLLIAGSIADVVGHRLINLIGCFLSGIFILATGFAQTGVQLIVFRAFQGIAGAMFLPTAMGIISSAIPSGKLRNLGFSLLGMGQVLGFLTGLVLSGVLIETIGWRFGFWLCGGVMIALAALGLYAVPKDIANRETAVLTRLRRQIDWVGGGIASVCMAVLAYVLAVVSTSSSNIRLPHIIAMLTVGVLLIPVFVFWVGKQERLGRPALIPNSLWQKKAFTSICLMVLIQYGVIQTMELLFSLYFQEVQHLSALQSSIRFLPSLIVGAILNLSTGLLVHKISAYHILLWAAILTAGSPLIMALIRSSGTYWEGAFFAQLLQPISADILFTIGLLVVSDVFPDETQSLAGAVFNMVSLFGQAVGLGIISVVTSSVQDKYPSESSEGLLLSFKAGFWTIFAMVIVAGSIGAYGLRGMGRIGLKRD